jgi:long-chain acyl-CoA synthetase
MYTSGSTGVPKGVLISHENFVAFASAAAAVLAFKDDDRLVHFLPLAHSMAFMAETSMLYNGVPMYFGNPRTVSSVGVRNCKGDIAETLPTLFVAVPAIFERVKHAVMAKVEAKSKLVQWLFNHAYEKKLHAIKTGGDAGFWDRLVFAKIRKEIGLDKIRMNVTGSAPISGKIQDWVRVVFNAPLTQGYGLTETCSCGTLQLPEDVSADTCGAPTVATEIKLVDCADLGYTNGDKPYPRGEIWIRGPTVTLGYYKAKDKTDEVYFQDKDSPYPWFATGDVGMWLPNGNLRIIDRKKHLIKPPHGEYIALEKLESVFKNCAWLSFLMVFADGTHYDCVLVGVPNAVLLLDWAKANNIPNASNLAALCKEPAVRKKILEELGKVGRNMGLKSIEMVRAVYLTHEEWTPQNSMLTAAMKLNRTVVVKQFAKNIETLYAELSK